MKLLSYHRLIFREKPEYGSWFYLSFCDTTKPAGTQFLGGIYVKGWEIGEALTRSHLLGINPGGEVQFVGPLPHSKLVEMVREEDRERLLTKEEVTAND